MEAAGTHTILKNPFAVRPVRVMTYNVHGCVGMDGRLSCPRIARVIEQYRPDIVALQELDVRRHRSGREDQACRIAETLEMDHFFHPAMRMEEEHFGDAILSRLPMTRIRAGAIERLGGSRRRLEPRGALWVRVEAHGIGLHVINTHLSLNSRERMLQIRDLLGPDWANHPNCTDHKILCGDFNAIPGSGPWKECIREMRTANETRAHRRMQRTPTWFGRFPLLQLDHIFVSPDLHPRRCFAGDTDLARIASDHRPLIADLSL